MQQPHRGYGTARPRDYSSSLQTGPLTLSQDLGGEQFYPSTGRMLSDFADYHSSGSGSGSADYTRTSSDGSSGSIMANIRDSSATSSTNKNSSQFSSSDRLDKNQAENRPRSNGAAPSRNPFDVLVTDSRRGSAEIGGTREGERRSETHAAGDNKNTNKNNNNLRRSSGLRGSGSKEKSELRESEEAQFHAQWLIPRKDIKFKRQVKAI